ncbi:CubicO group peptidase, beta-lactamase class C family [Actinopolymorpha cephalotaxi]|uniref:CubicO group peptidase (Beta-lactamase class C family) n=1 Tax=Actinopolymorpha cephalotaxi TaxID=504797 RepID=A0A1I3AY90_9ACTN|nr:serine hydrolase [Actinopolymorpha cephalotaxi]NYH84293.1 CubicO group peptidase (beta-lactamase class C family) [Actinopolymorpha cephalotaxi]SFH54994.1 CubicO group peptidase, beta-lactamase class C family [Actinopolymorpha cephalotaxi]
MDGNDVRDVNVRDVKEALPRSAPEAQGIPSGALLDFVTALEERVDAVHGFVLVRHGHVVAQGSWAPYPLNGSRMVFSLSKSFTSSAVGLAVDQGLLSVDDPVLKFFPDDAPEEVSDHLDRMCVRHLLTMTTGHAADTAVVRTTGERNWVRGILAKPVEHEPGTHFCYNSGASYLLSAIVQQVTGSMLLDYLRPRLLEPLGITDATWQTCPRGINTGGWGLTLRVGEIARFGQLYLQQGKWNDRQLIPREWVAEATSRQVGNDGEPEIDWRQGYGYQFWRCRNGAYRGDGAFGQYCLVMPEQDAVLAMIGGMTNMQGPLDLVWEHLLPAMGAEPLPADDDSHERLERRLATLALPEPSGRSTSPRAARFSGQTYRVRIGDHSGEDPALALRLPVRAAQTISFDVGGDGTCRLRLRDGGGEHEVAGGANEWLAGTTTLVRDDPDRVLVRATWTDEDTCQLRICFVGTPFIRTHALRFEGDKVTLTTFDNVLPAPSPVVAQLD